LQDRKTTTTPGSTEITEVAHLQDSLLSIYIYKIYFIPYFPYLAHLPLKNFSDSFFQLASLLTRNIRKQLLESVTLKIASFSV
jgi:hypothetical protein